MVEQSPHLASWREAVAWHARKAMLDAGWVKPGPREPVAVWAAFVFPKPKTGPDRDAKYHTGRSDLDKLLRSLLDAMTTAGVWADDAQVAVIEASKRLAPLHVFRIQPWDWRMPNRLKGESAFGWTVVHEPGVEVSVTTLKKKGSS